MLTWQPMPEAATARIAVVSGGGAGARVLHYLEGLDHIACVPTAVHAGSLGLPFGTKLVRIGARTRPQPFCSISPEWAARAARDDEQLIHEAVGGYDLLFVVAGMGGGVGTGAAPVVARIGRESGSLVIAAVSSPFAFEGRRRQVAAQVGIAAMVHSADMTVLIPYKRLRAMLSPACTMIAAFNAANEALGHAVRGLVGLVRSGERAMLDGGFESLRPHLEGCGLAHMGAGTGSNVYDAMDSAVSSPLLGDGTTSRARRVILNLTASNDTTLDELNTAFDHLRARLSEDASVIWNVDVGPGRAAAVLYATDFERRADSGL